MSSIAGEVATFSSDDPQDKLMPRGPSHRPHRQHHPRLPSPSRCPPPVHLLHTSLAREDRAELHTRTEGPFGGQVRDACVSFRESLHHEGVGVAPLVRKKNTCQSVLRARRAFLEEDIDCCGLGNSRGSQTLSLNRERSTLIITPRNKGEPPAFLCNYRVDHSTRLRQERLTIITTPPRKAEHPALLCNYRVDHSTGYDGSPSRPPTFSSQFFTNELRKFMDRCDRIMAWSP
nr:uncharacterized protein LOC129380945 [Dermacentor andersoni]